ncbi:MAG: hypothetical protein R2750_11750 [Bacteroidales bacterium]
MKSILPFLKSILVEALIIIFSFLLFNFYVGEPYKAINADGIGYYDYLPSLFIHRDFDRKDAPINKNPDLYNRVKSRGVYNFYGDYMVDKYPCGVAILAFPFFIYTHSLLADSYTGDADDGYQGAFQKTMFYTALFYLFLGLLFVRKVLKLYDVKRSVIIFCQVLIVFATSVAHYTYYDPAFSHIYSFFAITAFIYFSKSYFIGFRTRDFLFACLLLGLIVALRQINIMIVLFLPFLAGSVVQLKEGFIFIFKKWPILLAGLVLFLGIACIQCLAWYFQTGKFILYSYQGEGFEYLTNPQIINVLFSYKKGLFLYTPILLFCVLSVSWLIIKRKYYLAISWLSFFAIITYIFSAWESWFYGCSFGQRVYVDFYAIFFIPFAVMVSQAAITLKLIVVPLAFLTIPLSIIQTYQYEKYILSWMEMDKEKYWKVFLKTEDKYRGLIWKKHYDMSLYSTVKEVYIGDIDVPLNKYTHVYNLNSVDIPDFEKVSIIQIIIDSDFPDRSDTKIVVSINSKEHKQSFYWHESYLIRFHETKLDEWHTGFYNYEFAPITGDEEKVISFGVFAKNEPSKLSNVRIKFFTRL